MKTHSRLPLKLMSLLTASALALLTGDGFRIQAQSSVERLETTQEVKRPVDSSIRARDAVQKPEEKQTAAETGRVIGDYSWASSMELGYRSVETGGSRDKFLSDLYLRDGLRVLDFQMDARSISGHGTLFDFLRADVNNGGGDASQYYSFRMEKARTYRFDGTVRQFNYYRFLPTFSLNQHNLNLDRRMSDFDLKLLPQRAVRVNLGYSRSTSSGPFFTTYDYERDEFPVKGESRWESNDYRLGVDATYRRWDFFGGVIYRSFKNDTEYFQDAGTVNRGNNPATASSSLSLFERDDPTRSKAGVVHGSIRGDLTKRFHLVALGSHTEERLNVNEFDQTTGNASNGTTAILLNNIVTNGHAKRPSASADVGLTYDLGEHLSINNAFRYYSFRILGDLDAVTQSIRRAATGATTNTTTGTFDSRLTDYSSFWNTLQLQLNYGRKFSANAGWRATRRDVTLTAPGATGESDTQHTNAFIGGLRYRPLKSTSLFFGYEKGETNNAFVRINPLESQRFRVRANVQVTDSVSINSTFTATDTTNPTPQVNNDGNFRSFSVSASWEPKSRFWLTGGYNYDYLFNTAEIVFFLNAVQNRGRSIYYSRQHVVYLDSRVAATGRLDLFLVYRYLQDRGAPSSPDIPSGPNNFVTSFPLFRHNPEARIAFRFNHHLTGNV
ncbi:MAG TPA: hypothetical protein VJ302_05625, partial [Blastocatellia bacterium]|nr:hypothetical protein [Blastocatellia bacterium]